jgi:hypothetical protein
MIDTTKLSTDWGYGSLYGAKPTTGATTTGTKSSVTKTPTTTEETMDFQYPDAWAGLQDIYSKMANGTYSNPAYNEGLDWTRMMSQSGSPVDISGWADAYRPAMMDEYSNMAKQMAEQAGVGGTRYGSGLQNSIGNYGGQLMNQFNKEYMSNWLGTQENAKNRQMQAGSMFPTYANLGLNTTTTGTEGLLGLGNAQGNYFNNAMSNLLGGGQYSNSMSIDPWTQMMASLVGNSSYGQQTYNPSTFTNVLGVLGSMPWGSIFGGGGANTTASNGGWA